MPPASSAREPLAKQRMSTLLDYTAAFSKLNARLTASSDPKDQLELKGGCDGDSDGSAFVLHEAVLQQLSDATLESGEKCVFLGRSGLVWLRLRRPTSESGAGQQHKLLCSVYASLFSAHQEALREGRGAQVTVGVGIVRWKRKDGKVLDHPLVGIPAELQLDADGALVIRMADGAQAALWHMPGVADVAQALRRVAESAREYPVPLLGDTPPAPADREAWEPLLKRATYELDAQATYIDGPPKVTPKGSLAGAPDGTLRIFNGFVVWARQEAGELGVERDLSALKEAVLARPPGAFPAALARLVGVFDLPVQRSLAASAATSGGGGGHAADPPRGWLAGLGRLFGFGASGGGKGKGQAGGGASDFLYFGLPANAAQETVIERLAAFDCCVLVGPPGTGKSQTIANVICHYLATGRRVLVTSKGSEPCPVPMPMPIPHDARSVHSPHACIPSGACRRTRARPWQASRRPRCSGKSCPPACVSSPSPSAQRTPRPSAASRAASRTSRVRAPRWAFAAARPASRVHPRPLPPLPEASPRHAPCPAGTSAPASTDAPASPARAAQTTSPTRTRRRSRASATASRSAWARSTRS